MPMLYLVPVRTVAARLGHAALRVCRGVKRSPAILQCDRSIERLESRTLLSVSMGADGWTDFQPAPDTHIIYVSSSTGNDQNDGLSPDHAVQSIPRGVSLLRNNSADWMLLKAGDVWHSDLGTWRKSGRSNQEPMLIGSYGQGERPLLMTGNYSGFFAGAASNTEINHIAITGIHFYADGRDPNSPTYTGPSNTTGINLLTKTDGFWVEDCQIEDYALNINVQGFFGPVSNVSIRRNVIDDAYATTSHSQGLYALTVSNLLIEGNVFDHNGWNTQVPGGEATWFNHDCYLSSDNTNVIVRDNIFADASAYGLQARSGGDIEDNLFINDPIGMSFGLVNGARSTPGGVTGIVNGNVFIGGANMDTAKGGFGLMLGNTRAGYPTVVSNNIFTQGVDVAPAAITLTYGLGQSNPQDSVGLNDLTVVDNVVYQWWRGVLIDGGFQPGGAGLQALNDVTFSQNDFQAVGGAIITHDAPTVSDQEHWTDNTYSGPGIPILMGTKKISLDQWTQKDDPAGTVSATPYIDPSRAIESYNAAVGGLSSMSDFLAYARQQSKQFWRPTYEAGNIIQYFHDGFEVQNAAARDWSAPTPPIVSAASITPAVLSGDASFTFSVTYTDDKAVDISSLASGNLQVVSKRYSSAADLVSVQGAGNQVTATYSVPAPGGAFKRGKTFKFSLLMNGNEVKGSDGFSAVAGAVGTYKVRVLARPRPPVASGVRLVHKNQGLVVRFSSDVSATLQVSDLVLQSEDGQTVDPSLMALSWDAAHKTATWSFPGEPAGVLPAGRWHVRLLAASLTDTIGQLLDGNHDGAGGDDYVFSKALIAKT